MNLAPCASAGPDALSGSLVSCIEWLPSHPHDLLLVSFGAAMLTEKQAFSLCYRSAREASFSSLTPTSPLSDVCELHLHSIHLHGLVDGGKDMQRCKHVCQAECWYSTVA